MEARLCRHHPERPAVAVCVRCREAVCADCTTKLEGINYCAPCLRRRADAARPPKVSSRPAVVALGLVFALGLYWLAYLGLGWMFMLLSPMRT
jgi:hypothetical protein